MQKIAIGAVLALVIVAAAFYFLASGLDGTVARFVERVGTETLGAPVHVGDLEISIADGQARMSGLSVANPPGWDAATAFKLGAIAVKIAVPSISADGPIVLDAIDVEAPRVTLVVDEQGRSNLDEIRRQAGSASKASDHLEEGEEPAPGRKIRIDELRMRGGVIVADTRALGGDVRELELPDLDLREVGGPEGTSPGRIAETVATALVQQAVAEAAKAELENRAVDLLKDALGGEAGS
ncbi:MAG: hypothetical protein QNK05_25500 [Myxococcota bacterium]|nr:hypothetical protein [Myxococcota bacterium]